MSPLDIFKISIAYSYNIDQTNQVLSNAFHISMTHKTNKDISSVWINYEKCLFSVVFSAGSGSISELHWVSFVDPYLLSFMTGMLQRTLHGAVLVGRSNKLDVE